MKSLNLFITTFFFFATTTAQAKLVTKTFSGTAKNSKGKTLYSESHTVTFYEQNIQTAKTIYSYKSKEIAILSHDFSKSLSVPEHVFYDYRQKSYYGLKHIKDSKYLMQKGEAPTYESAIKELEKNADSEEEIVINKKSVSSQGFNYLISKNRHKELSSFSPFDFILPGKMTRVDFKLETQKKDGKLNVTLKADSFFIRLFAPTLFVQYDLELGNIVHYEGASNILDPSGNNQKVIIDYYNFSKR